MKRWLLIIGIIITLILAGLWVYLLTGGNITEDGNKFSLFQFGDTTDTTIPEGEFTQPVAEEPIVDVSDPSPLRQLTTTPVVGYREVQLTASSSPLAYYVEAGTGHVYTIDLETGVENRISNITVPSVVDATISSDGQFVALRTDSYQAGELTIVTLPTSSSTLSSLNISEKVIDYSITNDNQLLYAVHTNNETIAKDFDLIKKTTETLFEIPFREVAIDWGNTVAGPHYFYPKPNSQLKGYLYQVLDGDISRKNISGYGLSGIGTEEVILYGLKEDNYTSYIYTDDWGYSNRFVPTLPEKCVIGNFNTAYVFCAASSEPLTNDLPEAWYRGEFNFSDSIWVYGQDSLYQAELLNLFTNSGQMIDAVNLVLGTKQKHLLFSDRKNQSLWLYDFSENILIE